MLTIDRILTTVFRLPLYGTLRWGKASLLDEVRHVLVRVILSDGSTGVAEAPPRPTIYGETVHSIVSIIEHELAPRLRGLPVGLAEMPAIQSRLHEIKNNHTAKGAVDMALWDALAAHQGASLPDLLGASQRHVKVSYILGIGSEDDVLAEAQRVVAQGVRVLKVKVGRDWPADVERIRRLQATLGADVTLYADANECFDPEEAPTRLAELADLGLAYCEEPIPVELIRQRVELRTSNILPLIADDSAFTLRDLRRELLLDTFDILNIKTARTGYTESRAMLAMARQHGKGVMVGSQASAGLGTARAGLFAGLPDVDHPSELSFFLKLKEDIIDRPIRLHDGFIDLRELAEIQVDEALLQDAACF
jgi:L-alanine-DL-glutamate epimerase-like enolase superfamily enzyme